MLVCSNGHEQPHKCAKFCLESGAKLVDSATATICVRGEKESNYLVADELGLDEEAARTFSYAGLEIHLTVEINIQTEEATASGIVDKDDRLVPLEHPISI